MGGLVTTLAKAGLWVAAVAGMAMAAAAPAQDKDAARGQPAGLRGEETAIEKARLMVATMGGPAIWARLACIHFTHEWHPWNRPDTYVENEVLDLVGPRSLADRKSEINHAIRAYSPEGGRWDLRNGTLAHGSAAALASDLARAPFNFYRLVRAVAIGDPHYEVRFGKGDIPGTRRLEFYGPEGILGGWIILNARNEPIVKATPDYRFTLGPLKRFGNLRIPAWGVYDNGTTRYEMIALSASDKAPDAALFLPPPKFRDAKGSGTLMDIGCP